MSRIGLRWWLWSCCTFMVMLVAGMFGFYRLLLANDVTYLGLCVIGIYVVSTAWLALKVRAKDTEYGFLWYISEIMEKVGLLGTFVGLAIVFQGLASLDPNSPGFKIAVLHGVLTKLYCSIVGIIGGTFLKTQIKILEA